jgi:hypothetical protein
MPKLEMDAPRTRNPAGNTVYHVYSVQAPSAAVAKQQDPKHTEAKFLNDLDRATSNRGKERIAKSKVT